jgi:hypothetical protein
MAISSDVLRKELGEVMKGLDVAMRERQEADRKVSMMEAKKQAYLTLLGDDAETVSPSQDSTNSANEEGTQSKRALIRQEVQNAGPSGAKPVTIFQALKAKGVKRAYVHSTLSRMKDSGIVTERNGKYSIAAVQ